MNKFNSIFDKFKIQFTKIAFKYKPDVQINGDSIVIIDKEDNSILFKKRLTQLTSEYLRGYKDIDRANEIREELQRCIKRIDNHIIRTTPDNKPSGDLFNLELSVRTCNVLRNNGIYYIADFMDIKEAQLIKMNRVGRRTIREVKFIQEEQRMVKDNE